MRSCEHFEEQLSAWLDHELERSEQMELLDHLVRCESCRRFTMDARALDGFVATVREPLGEAPPSPEIWARIEQSAAAPAVAREARRASRPSVPAWVMQAAAVVVLAVGLGALFWVGSQSRPDRPHDAIVQLGEDSGAMTDERFVELTKEVLRAEPRYHSAFYRVMDQVIKDTRDQEASVDYDDLRAPVGDTLDGDRSTRQPV